MVLPFLGSFLTTCHITAGYERESDAKSLIINIVILRNCPLIVKTDNFISQYSIVI